jgi:hypothetical protein
MLAQETRTHKALKSVLEEELALQYRATQFTAGPETGFTSGPAVSFTAGPEVGFTSGPAVSFTAGPEVGFTSGPEA